MKKLITLSFAALLIGCENPSMERGLESLNASLAELEASFIALNLEQIEADLLAMNDQVEDMIVDAEEANQVFEEALVQVEGILASLANVREKLEESATEEQLQAIGVKVAQITEGIDRLVFLADYDHDGVINGLDECPDTPITEINNVNEVGCSPSQIDG